MKLLRKLDEIIEDPRKTKAVILFLEHKGLIDPDAVALWEIEQSNKEAIKCNHQHPDGVDATFDAVGYTTCSICGASDLDGDGL